MPPRARSRQGGQSVPVLNALEGVISPTMEEHNSLELEHAENEGFTPPTGDPETDSTLARKLKLLQTKHSAPSFQGRVAKPLMKSGRFSSTASAPVADDDDGDETLDKEDYDEVLISMHGPKTKNYVGQLAALTAGVMAFKNQRKKHLKPHWAISRLQQVEDSRRAGEMTQIVLWALTIACWMIVVVFTLRHWWDHGVRRVPDDVTWALICGLPYPISIGCQRIVEAAVFGLEVLVMQWDRNVSYVLIGMQPPLRRWMTATLVEWCVELLRWQNYLQIERRTIVFLRKLLLCICIFFAVEVASRLLCRLLALRVHSKKLFEQFKRAIHAEEVLDKLMVEPTVRSFPAESLRTQEISRSWKLPVGDVPEFMIDLYNLSLPMEDRAANFTSQMTRLVKQFEYMPTKECDARALNGAEYFWWTVRNNAQGIKLELTEVTSRLEKPQDIELAEELFDTNNDGWVIKEEVTERFLDMFRERKNIARTIRDTNEALETIQSLLGSLLHLFAIVAYLHIFSFKVLNFLISISSVSIAFAFVFGNQLRALYESIIFIFIIQPYRVGDKIMYNGDPHVVKNFGLLTTQLARYDGARVWVPNDRLMTTDIVNVTHSTNVAEVRSVDIDYDKVTRNMLKDLRHRVSMLAKNPDFGHLFNADVVPSVHIESMQASLKFQVVVYYQLKVTAMELTSVYEARTEVQLVIGEWLKHHQILHSQSIQPGLLHISGSQSNTVA